MIYNVVGFLKNQFPSELFYTQIRQQLATQEFVPDRNVLIRDTGGIEDSFFKYGNETIQILTRDKSAPRAKSLAQKIYNILHGRFGLVLPAVNIDGVNYPEVQVPEIRGLQLPTSIGTDEEKRPEFSFNIQIYRVREG